MKPFRWSKKHSVDKTQAVQGATGSTALHVACANGCVKIVDLLLRNNARVDVKDKYGSTPLDVAQAKHETYIIHLLKAAKKKQRKDVHHLKQRNMSYNDDLLHENNNRKSIDGIMTHKRSASDKPRMRRPSLPSITEGSHHAIPTLISMTPSTSSNSEQSRRSFSAAHRPSMEEILNHSCPATPRSSLDQQILNSRRSHASSLSVPNSISPRSSEDSSRIILGSSPATTSSFHIPAGPTSDWSIAATSDGRPDWYGYGVVNHYDDENYLLSLERRAFNLDSNDNDKLDRHSEEMTRKSHDGSISDLREGDLSQHQLLNVALKNNALAHKSVSSFSANDSTSLSDAEFGDEDNDEDDYQKKPLPRPSIVIDDGPEADAIRYRFEEIEPRAHSTDQQDIKRGWFSGRNKYERRYSLDSIQRKSFDSRPNFNHLTFDTVNKPHQTEDESTHKHQRFGFLSRWAPTWSKK